MPWTRHPPELLDFALNVVEPMLDRLDCLVWTRRLLNLGDAVFEVVQVRGEDVGTNVAVKVEALRVLLDQVDVEPRRLEGRGGGNQRERERERERERGRRGERERDRQRSWISESISTYPDSTGRSNRLSHCRHA